MPTPNTWNPQSSSGLPLGTVKTVLGAAAGIGAKIRTSRINASQFKQAGELHSLMTDNAIRQHTAETENRIREADKSTQNSKDYASHVHGLGVSQGTPMKSLETKAGKVTFGEAKEKKAPKSATPKATKSAKGPGSTPKASDVSAAVKSKKIGKAAADELNPNWSK